MKNKMHKLSNLLNHPWIASIRGGLMSIQGIVFITCFISIGLNISLELLSLYAISGKEMLISFLLQINYVLNIFLPIFPVITISYKLVKIKNRQHQAVQENALLISLTSFITFILISSTSSETTFDPAEVVNHHMYLINAFLAIIVAISTTEIYCFISKKYSQRFNNIKYSHDRELRESLQYMIPAILTVLITLSSTLVMLELSKYLLGSLMIVFKTIMTPLGTFINQIVYVILTQLCWFIGINGGNLIHSSFFEQMFSYEMIDKTFLDTFINIGGTGTILGLLVAMIYFIKRNPNSQFKNLVKFSLFPILFNINEIIIYGLSIIFNPIYFIPFLVVPIVLTAMTSLFQQVGIIPSNLQEIDWRTPIFMSGYLATNSIRGSLVQVFNIIIAASIYYPFVKWAHVFNESQNNKVFNELKEIIFSEERETKYLVNREGELGCLTRKLGDQLKELLNSNQQLFLVFQPQVNKHNEVMGVEALIRWKHPSLGMIPPNVIVTIAEENRLIYELGKWTIKEACTQLKKWNDKGIYDIKMSINISNLQLKDPYFATDVLAIIKDCHLNMSDITLEITESIAIGQDATTHEQLNMLTEAGIKLAIDDFGKGYNPILYLKEYSISCIKLDGCLIKDITEDLNSQHIVSSMYHLCRNSNLDIVCEFVETEEQKKLLDTLGDGIYQGYLFSPPLLGEDCLHYIKKHNKSDKE